MGDIGHADCSDLGQNCCFWTKQHQLWIARARDSYKMLLMQQCRFDDPDDLDDDYDLDDNPDYDLDDDEQRV